jgi:hypothetical protein
MRIMKYSSRPTVAQGRIAGAKGMSVLPTIHRVQCSLSLQDIWVRDQLSVRRAMKLEYSAAHDHMIFLCTYCRTNYMSLPVCDSANSRCVSSSLHPAACQPSRLVYGPEQSHRLHRLAVASSSYLVSCRSSLLAFARRLQHHQRSQRTLTLCQRRQRRRRRQSRQSRQQ